ncbi:hypothetical protein SAMN05660485_03352 [Blastococcus fimeti]|nr:hypothetical protein SAMN05660485_03352 [Blastococcus fimeti]
MRLSDLQLANEAVAVSHLVLNSGGRRLEFIDVTAAFAAGFIHVERYLNGQVVVTAYPAAAVEVAEDIRPAVGPRGGGA